MLFTCYVYIYLNVRQGITEYTNNIIYNLLYINLLSIINFRLFTTKTENIKYFYFLQKIVVYLQHYVIFYV